VTTLLLGYTYCDVTVKLCDAASVYRQRHWSIIIFVNGLDGCSVVNIGQEAVKNDVQLTDSQHVLVSLLL